MDQQDGYVASQFGLINRTQGVRFYGEAGFKRRVRVGDLVREVHGYYRTAGAPVSPDQELYLATFAYNGVASHRAAGGLHDFERCAGHRLEVTVKASVGTRKRLARLDVTVHRSNLLPEPHIDLVRGISCTSPARTLCDLSLYLSALSLGEVVDDAKRRRLVEYEAIAACRDDLRARGRRRTTVIDEVLEARGIGFDPGDSKPELRVRRWLEDAGMPPVVQHPLMLRGKRRRLDLAYPVERVAVEYLGIDPHGLPIRVIDDADRTTALQLAGWLVVLITKKTTKREAVDMVREALQLRGRRF